MRLLSVDPGIRGVGAALFESGLLIKAFYIKNPQLKGDGAPAWTSLALATQAWAGPVNSCAVELMKVYQGSKQKGDPNDLIQLAGVAGALAGALATVGTSVVSFLASEWKGQVPKDIMGARILGRLSSAERSTIQSIGARDHNTIDAIGIGLHFLRRL